METTFIPTPVDGISHPEPCRKVTRAPLSGEHKARTRRYLGGKARIYFPPAVDLGLHLRAAEVLIVEADADTTAFRAGPRQHARGHEKNYYLIKVVIRAVPRASMLMRAAPAS